MQLSPVRRSLLPFNPVILRSHHQKPTDPDGFGHVRGDKCDKKIQDGGKIKQAVMSTPGNDCAPLHMYTAAGKTRRFLIRKKGLQDNSFRNSSDR